MRVTGPWGALGGALAFFLSASAHAQSTYYVAEDGDDGADGSAAAPWATLQHAADTVEAGDTVVARAGSYRGFYLETSGTAAAPITFRGEPGAIIDRDNETTPDGINLEGASYVVVEGFTVDGASRAGIRAVLCEHVTIRGNRADANGRWGIFTGFCDDLLIEDNECSRSADEHGIYVSNSGDRPHIRGNRLWGNNANGVHMNGDASAGGDGVISDALVEQNIIWDNGEGGGSGINCDGVQDSVIQNNLIYENHASGISLYQIDGGAPSTGNLVINNTVVQASDARWAMNIQDGATDNTVRNNIFLSRHPSRGAIDISSDSLDGLASDYNVVIGRFTIGGDTFIDFAEWRAMSGQGASSIEAAIEEVFVDAGSDDYHLSASSPALDQGTSTDAPSVDFEDQARPIGAGVDIGADERCPEPCDMPIADAGAPRDAGTITLVDGGRDGGSTAPPDASSTPDAGDAAEDTGCGCRAVGRPSSSSAAWLGSAALALLFLRRRRG